MAAHAARQIAIELINSVLVDGYALDPDELAQSTDATHAERARAMRLSRATIRFLSRADAVLKPFLRKAPVSYVQNVLRLAVVELHFFGEAPHGVIDDAVKLVKSHRKHNRLSGLANAVLRKTVQSSEVWAAATPNSLPQWIARPIKTHLGKPTQKAVEAAHEGIPPIDITLKSPGDFSLPEAVLTPTGSARLPAGGLVSALPGYEEGDWWVQDAAAALPAKLLGQIAGKSVLDLCAAPGGKTMQLAAAGAKVTALDASTKRTKRLRENLARTGLSAEIVVADALDWTPDAKFDAIVLDAPCTATGTIRRHPELPFVKDDGELEVLLPLQFSLLERAAKWLKPNGKLVFCTCSLLPQEGEDQAQKFLEKHKEFEVVPPDFKTLDVPSDWATPEGGIRTRPDYWVEIGGMDGFFMIVLRKAGDN